MRGKRRGVLRQMAAHMWIFALSERRNYLPSNEPADMFPSSFPLGSSAIACRPPLLSTSARIPFTTGDPNLNRIFDGEYQRHAYESMLEGPLPESE